MKMKKIDVRLFQILFFVLAGTMICTVLGMKSLVSVFFAMTFPLTVALWLRCVRNGLDRMDWLILVTAGLAFVCVLVNLISSGGSFGVSYFKKPIMFVMTLLLLRVCDSMHAGGKLRRFLHGMTDILVIFLTAAHIMMRARMHTLNDIPTPYAAFGFSNPNLTAIFFTCMYMLELIRVTQVKTLRDKVFHGILTALMGFFVLDTTSRNGLLVMTLFTVLVLCVVYRNLIRKKTGFRVPLRISLPAAGIISVVPAVFALLYMALINAAWVQKVFAFLVSEGKQLDSRVKMWSPALEAIRKAPLTGDFYGITGGTGSGQMHNTHMDIAASYGIPVLILVCVLLTFLVFRKGKRYTKRSEYLYMLGFCCTLMLGIFESVMFSGGLGTYIFMCAFLLLSKSPATEART